MKTKHFQSYSFLSMSRLQKRMLTFKSKEPRRTHWRTGALNHAIPRGSVWHNVETNGPVAAAGYNAVSVPSEISKRLWSAPHLLCFLVADLANRSPGSGDNRLAAFESNRRGVSQLRFTPDPGTHFTSGFPQPHQDCLTIAIFGRNK